MKHSDFDAVVNDDRWSPYRGWHGDYAGKSIAEYLPAVQQDRGEFLGLVEAIEAAGLVGGKCLQLGLGHVGGAHKLFQAVFSEVWSVDIDLSVIRKYVERFPGDGNFIVGDTREMLTFHEAKKREPFDFLFIDAGHSYADVRADYINYAPLVRNGGMIAFHDAIQRGANDEIRVWAFLEEVRREREVHILGLDIGTAWLIR